MVEIFISAIITISIFVLIYTYIPFFFDSDTKNIYMFDEKDEMYIIYINEAFFDTETFLDHVSNHYGVRIKKLSGNYYGGAKE